jgi:tetratricopeptide (TPR) repeat protein
MDGHLSDVLSALDEVVATYPRAASFLFERGRLHSTLGRDAAAEEDYRSVLRIDMRHFRALNDLALLYFRHKLLAQAEICLRAATVAEPENVIGATNHALILLERGQLEQARAEFERALAIDPENQPAQTGLNSALKGLGVDNAGSMSAAPPAANGESIVNPNPDRQALFEQYVFDVAANGVVAGDDDAVAYFLEKIAGDKPDAARLVRRLGDFASREHKYAAALQTYRHAERLEPDNREIQLAIAATLEDLGNVQAADALWQSDALRGLGRIYAYTGNTPPVRLLTIASALNSMRYDLFVDSSVIANTAIYTQAYADGHALPEHDVVLVAVGDADGDARALDVARRIVARLTAPVINHPERVATTGRREQAERLGALDGVRTARMHRASRDALCGPAGAALVRELGFDFPLLLRSPGYHNGQFFEKIDREADLEAIASRLPGNELLLISFEDTQSRDGKTRKFRMMSIAGTLYPIHLAISSKWKVHYTSADMAKSTAFRDEEAAYLKDPLSFLGGYTVKTLQRIADGMGLDYAGIDFGLDPGGRVVVYEANAAMGIFMPNDDPRWDYRRQAFRTALNAATEMIVGTAYASSAVTLTSRL